MTGSERCGSGIRGVEEDRESFRVGGAGEGFHDDSRIVRLGAFSSPARERSP
jgi:hypothetical protein